MINNTRKHKSPQRKLFDKVWKECSAYIRERDKYKCYTYGIQGDKYTIQAGHFIHGKTKKTYFNADNIHAQCVKCNKYLSGNLALYGVKMIKELGQKRVEKLIWESRPIYIWKIKELEELHEIYKNLNKFTE